MIDTVAWLQRYMLYAEEEASKAGTAELKAGWVALADATRDVLRLLGAAPFPPPPNRGDID